MTKIQLNKKLYKKLLLRRKDNKLYKLLLTRKDQKLFLNRNILKRVITRFRFKVFYLTTSL